MTIPIDREAFKVVNSEGESIDEGNVILFCGVGQPDARTQALTGHQSLNVSL